MSPLSFFFSPESSSRPFRGVHLRPALRWAALSIWCMTITACSPGDEARNGIVLTTPNGTRLPADGQTGIEITLDAMLDGAADNSPVSLSVDSGSLAGDGVEVEGIGRTATVTPRGGKATFTYRCEDGKSGTFFVRAQNANSSGGLSVMCVSANLSVDLQADVSGCANLQADGASFCPVVLQVSNPVLDDVNSARDIPIRVVVKRARTNFEEDGDKRVLFTEQVPDLVDNLEFVTDDSGRAVFFVRSTQRDLVQTLSLTATMSPPGATSQSIEFAVSVDPFEDNSSLALVADVDVIGTGQTATLQINAVALDGAPAAQAEVTVSVPPGSGASVGDGANPGDSVTVVLDANGSGAVTFHAPDVSEETSIQVFARYAPSVTVSALEVSETIVVFPEGAILIAGAAEPQQIRSDANETARLTATLRRFRNGAFEPVVDVPVTFRVRPGDSARVMIGARPEPLPAGFSPTLAATVSSLRAVTEDGEDIGRASILVSAQNERIRGRTIIEVSTIDNGQTYETEIALDVERDPIPQSLIFVSATPDKIHVRGSAFPAASVLSFQVLDDTNQPLSDVFVRFDLNRTADPAATVLGGDFTGPDGTVSTVVSAGTQAGPISVIATATFENRSLTAESLPIVVEGGLPTFTESYIHCEVEDMAQIAPFAVSCSAVLVDRFTNRAPANLPVHFRAEGGNVNPTSLTNEEGNATVDFVSGGLGPSTASLLSANYDSWSYGAILPMSSTFLDTETTRFNNAMRDACFDGSSHTECDLVGLCRVALNEPYCPLGLDVAEPTENCWDHLNAFALTRDTADIGPELLRAIAVLRGGNPDSLVDLSAARSFLENEFDATSITGFNYFVDDVENTVSTHEYVRAVVDTYLQNQFRCGFQTSCLVGQRQGLPFLNHDSCPLNGGCMDFSTDTLCPQDGLLTLTAHFRGEESFIDVNGNGRFDFFDENNSGQHEYQETAFEPFIDLPEPYLDRNDNCVYDDLSVSERLQPVERARHSDLFSDSDGSGDFGFRDPQGPDEPRNFTNSHWDRDTMVFLSRHILEMGDTAYLEYGQPCRVADIGQQVTCDLAERLEANGYPRTAVCLEAGSRVDIAASVGNANRIGGLAPGCIDALMQGANPVILGPDDSFRFSYRWRDKNGNCVSPGFAFEASAETEGSIEAVGETLIALNPGRCGFQESRNVSRPWCTEQRKLGAKLLDLVVAANCANTGTDGTDSQEQGHLGSLRLTVDDESAEFGFRVFCPVCGNGALEEGEECDDGGTEAGDGCDSRCRIE